MRWRDEDPGGESPGSPFSLTPGAVHEWIGPFEMDTAACSIHTPRRPPILLLSHFAREAWAREPAGWSVWVGRACWPYAPALVPHPHAANSRADRQFLNRCLFVDTTGRDEHAQRVWAAELALRCRSVSVVVMDASGLAMNESRRLQLAAKAGGGVGLLARPAREAKELSCAASRWAVLAEPSPTDQPRWTVELLRCKGVQPAPEHPREWVLEWNREACGIRVPADVVNRPAATASPGVPGTALRIA